jgi:hypothetical protein
MTDHIELRVEPDGVEPVHVEMHEGRLRVLFSPGLVYGVAAGDELEVTDGGSFKVLRRGGNVAVRVLCARGVSSFAHELQEKVSKLLGGRLDGRLRNGLVFTIPVTAGFKSIENVFEGLQERESDVLWEFGNVYDRDGSELGWWK